MTVVRGGDGWWLGKVDLEAAGERDDAKEKGRINNSSRYFEDATIDQWKIRGEKRK